MNAFAVQVQVPTGRVQLVDVRRRALLMAQLRVLLIGVVFLAIAAAALLRIAWLGVVQPAPNHRSMADALLPPRGEITDRNGVPLARAFPDARIIVIERDPRAILASLAAMAERDVTQAAHVVSYLRHWRKNVVLARRFERDPALEGRLLRLAYEELAAGRLGDDEGRLEQAERGRLAAEGEHGALAMRIGEVARRRSAHRIGPSDRRRRVRARDEPRELRFLAGTNRGAGRLCRRLDPRAEDAGAVDEPALRDRVVACRDEREREEREHERDEGDACARGLVASRGLTCREPGECPPASAVSVVGVTFRPWASIW